jgi:hypothetical protein
MFSYCYVANVATGENEDLVMLTEIGKACTTLVETCVVKIFK